MKECENILKIQTFISETAVWNMQLDATVRFSSLSKQRLLPSTPSSICVQKDNSIVKSSDNQASASSCFLYESSSNLPFQLLQTFQKCDPIS
jgi:hypothetical protein